MAPPTLVTIEGSRPLPTGAPRSPWWRRPLAVVTVAWLAGAVPTTNIVARRLRGVDLRRVGTGTVSGTALYREAGFVPMAAAGLADIAKGTVGPLLAGRDRPALSALAAGAGVTGHNWSPLLGGAGGRGISPAIGALGVRCQPGTALLLGSLTTGRLVRRSGLGTFVGLVGLVPLLGRSRGREGTMTGVAVMVPMLAKRILGNRLPERRRGRVLVNRLLFDEDPAT